jgi:HlyD family secretion protein
VSLADLNDLQVELDIAQADFARLGPAQKAKVTTDAYPDKEYDGVIAQISPEANRQKATVQVKVQVLNPDKYPDIQLRPEMNATVKFLANDTPKNAKGPSGVYVPSTAIHDRDGKKIVLIAYNGKAVAREIHVVGQRSDGALVDGLVGGETVISAGPSTLKDGDKIKIKGQS